MLVNEPPSNDPKFFGGKALTYYGRWTYKYEEAARKGAAGVILIHKTEMASYGWDVVRNSWSGERSFLRDDPEPKLKLAAWIQLDVAHKLAQDLRHEPRRDDRAAGKPGFKAVQLPAKAEGDTSSARCGSSIPTTSSPCCRAPTPSSKTRPSCTARTTITSASCPAWRATTSTTARRTMRPAAASCWRSRAPTPATSPARSARCTSLRSRPRSRGCWARSTLASIRRFRRRTFRWT